MIRERSWQEDSEETLGDADERNDSDSAMIAGNTCSTTSISRSENSEEEAMADVKKILEELDHIKRRVLEIENIIRLKQY